MKAIFLFMTVVAALLIVSTEADAAALRTKQTTRTKTVTRGLGARGFGGASVQQNTFINTGFGVQSSFRQRSFSTGYGAAVQLQAAPVYVQPLMTIIQPAAQIIQPPAQVYIPPAQVQIQAAPVMTYVAPAQFDVAPVCPSCVAPAMGIVRQRTIIRGY